MSHRRQAPIVAVLSMVVTLVAASAAAAATIAIEADGTAVFQAAPGETNIVRFPRTNLYDTVMTVSDSGAPLTVGAGCQQVDANTATCPEPQSGKRPVVYFVGDGDDRANIDDNEYRLVSVYGEAGNDTVTVGNRRGTPAVLDGGTGDDQLTTWMDGPAVPILRGGAGNDVLVMNEGGGGHAFGGDGADLLRLNPHPLGSSVRFDGGAGDDTYNFTFGFSSDAMTPGPGIDTLDQSGAYHGFDFEMSRCSGCVEIVLGSGKADRIIGDDLPQAIHGGGDDDFIDGGGGADELAGMGGNDTILSRDRTTDAVSCGDGTDVVTADGRDRPARDCESIWRGK